MNPLYDWLKYSLAIELEIAKKRNDLNSVAMCLNCHDVFGPIKHTREIAYLKDALENKGASLKDSIAIAFIYRLNEESKLKLSASYRNSIENLIGDLPNTSIPEKIKILAYDMVSGVKDKNVEKLKEHLLEKQKDWRENNRRDDLIEVDSILGKEYYSDIWKNITPDKDFTIDKIAKLGTILLESSIGKPSTIINILESKLRNIRSKSVLPKISLSVYEAEKLIDSNLPPQQLNELLNSLKKQQEWTKLIKTVQEDGITLDLERLHNITILSTEDIVFSIKFIQLAGRTRLHQITPKQFTSLKEYVEIRKSGGLVIKRSDLKIFYISTSIISFAYLFYWMTVGKPAISNLFSGKELFSNLPVVINTLGDLTKPSIALLFGIRYYLRAWKSIADKHVFVWSDIIRSLFWDSII